MKERPILFSGEMVRALLREENPKTMTRRVVKFPYAPKMLGAQYNLDHQSAFPASNGGWIFYTAPAHLITERMKVGDGLPCPYGQPGDRLWVRETWQVTCPETEYGGCSPIFQYKADYPGDGGHWRSPIHMTRLASRITLEITAVRVERVQDISEEDARAEGISGPHDVGYSAYRMPGDSKPRYSTATAAFEDYWDSLNAKRGYGWDANPWVWVIEFRRIRP